MDSNKVNHKYNYNWSLSDTNFTKDKGKVFSTFSCGGGSTMGYKLAGFDVIGNLEFDEKKNQTYVKNHNPKYNFCEDIRDFKNRTDIPDELYNLDILDGSPPCLAFSSVGEREASWGVESKREGVKHAQTWDDLFFELCDLAKKLQPKVVVAENVKGMLLGNAIEYVRGVYEGFDNANYYCQHFLLNASDMGVPQKRERVFFICIRKDLAKDFLVQEDLFTMKPYIDMKFDESPIFYGEYADYNGEPMYQGDNFQYYYSKRLYGDMDMCKAYERENKGERMFFSQKYLYEDKVCFTLTAHKDCIIPFNKPVWLSKDEVCNISTFPHDYDFCNSSFHELCGRAVPPVMMAQIASRIHEQWLSKL